MNNNTGKFLPIFPFTRRGFIKTAGGAGVALFSNLGPGVMPGLASNPTGRPLHGLSSFGQLKYPSDYTHFDYANPEAPKGGVFSFFPSYWFYNQNVQTFNTLNTFVLKGAAPPRMELCFDVLMTRAIDEPDALYCATARSVEISPDQNSYIFTLRNEARFHDGSPITAEDVAFSYNVIKQKGHPIFSTVMRNLEEVRALTDNRVDLHFNGRQSDREILSLAGRVPILSRLYYRDREFDSSTLERPLSSGPWRVGNFSPGQFIEYEKVDDYWAREMPFARGLGHFEKLRIEFYSERIAAFEAFKKGNILYRQEFTSKVWATEYNFPAFKQGKVIKKVFSSEKIPLLQGWAVNTRRGKFADIRVRQAIGLCFDFEWTNKNLFYDVYVRSQSSFERSPFVAVGRPDAEELKLLQELEGPLPKAVFGEAVMQPVSNGSGHDRKNLNRAFELFREAGWRSRDGRLVNNEGLPFNIEFLIAEKISEKVLGGLIANLRRIGVEARIRLVDPTQYQKQIEEFDFDIIGLAFSFSAVPTEVGFRQFFHSASSDIQGSYNYPGIRLKAVDQLVEKLSQVQSQKELTTVVRVLDRILRAYQFWIPNWYSKGHNVAMWDVFGWKDPKPDYFFPVESLFWFDKAKAEKIGKG